MKTPPRIPPPVTPAEVETWKDRSTAIAKAAIAKATTEPSTKQESIASIILSNLFDGDLAYRTECMECALEIIESGNSKQ